MTPITAFPGTEFYNEMSEKHMITSHNYKHYDLFHPMMRTEQLSSIEIYRLVAEAYSAYYLCKKSWLKMLLKRYINPFGKFNWMMGNIPRFAKTVIVSGLDMLHSMGMTHSIISDEMNEIMAQAKAGKPLLTEKSETSNTENERVIIKKQSKKEIKIST
jgi:hypothetical protein